jgi:arylsulfatase A-like enzyme
MNRRELLSLAVPAAAAVGRIRAADRTVRNVVFILSDDHSAEAVGCYGNPIVRTPNLDRLASEGVRFAHAYVNSPLCSPSRQSMLTGKLPHASGVTLLNTPLAAGQITLAEHLKERGFATGAIGKMHFNNDLPHGFDYRVPVDAHAKHLEKHPPRKPPDDVKVFTRWAPNRSPAREWLNAEKLPVPLYDEDSEGTFFTRRAIEFVESNRNSRFFLWLSFREPHGPFRFPIEYKDSYDPAKMPLPKAAPEDERWIPKAFRELTEQQKRGIIASYYSSTEYLDKNVGLLLDAIDRLGLRDDTLVIYAGDNGYLLGHHGRFEKHNMWEPAVRVPLIIRDPRAQKGEITDALVEMVDLAPTMLGALGVPPMKELHGKSLAPVLEGRATNHREEVFSEYLPDNMAMIRTPDWKYIFTSGKHDQAMGYETGYGASGILHRLYDVRQDPGETHNVAGDPKNKRLVEELQAKMLARFKATHPKAKQLPENLSTDEALTWFCEPPDPEGAWDPKVWRPSN